MDGINGAVDLDEGYIDYTKLVKERGLNGFSAATITTPVADTQKTAAVILQIGDDIYKGTLTKA